MSRPAPPTKARETVAKLLKVAREAGWARARCELQPDGTTIIDASMTDSDGGDDFLDADLRMGK